MTISICMIVKNESKVLERCLECAKKFCDEIIIVDTGSNDNTKEIAFKYTDKVYDFKWCNDFSKARNYAFSKATKEYIMWLDADDVIKDYDIKKIIDLKNNNINCDIDIFMLKYAISFDECDNITFSYYRERIIKNCYLALWQGRVHEVIVPFGKIEYKEIFIEHRKITNKCDSYRNLNIYKEMIKENYIFSARDNYYYARELFFHKNYNKAINIFEKIINDDSAWIENKVDAYRFIAKCYYNLGFYDKFVDKLIIGNMIDTPRAEICCELANYFFENNNLIQAIFWYKNALNCEINQETGAFIEHDFYGYIPYLQICVCLDRLGKIEEAFEYNKKAEKIKKYSKAVILNNNYFEKKLKKV